MNFSVAYLLLAALIGGSIAFLPYEKVGLRPPETHPWLWWRLVYLWGIFSFFHVCFLVLSFWLVENIALLKKLSMAWQLGLATLTAVLATAGWYLLLQQLGRRQERQRQADFNLSNGPSSTKDAVQTTSQSAHEPKGGRDEKNSFGPYCRRQV